ncbi:hypothetical protein Salat_0195100 [Sesamum alatum]|uniref:Uncharacterized protein n=1 Tax=Sesamum alatum TaxID=300844 RepID=A0AAE2CXT7_9LAMI|nr:hypothetical protein Salat_0195100 [Sesamum alatum]
MSPATQVKLLVPSKSSTTCGRSRTMHFMLGNASPIALAVVPVPTPNVGQRCDPLEHSFVASNKYVIQEPRITRRSVIEQVVQPWFLRRKLPQCPPMRHFKCCGTGIACKPFAYMVKGFHHKGVQYELHDWCHCQGCIPQEKERGRREPIVLVFVIV